ncbi:unnamed protein product [Acanthoscelides obtectus]|uniref:Serine/arginine repetitive matrix protein 1 n=1 Tax=Acanthoscelides obtectus TaxID=200917 RepID=A0A9P0L0M2_ACAOB|nr:unnamed protein product [Acanthoscelides obtectus]CAK1666177.1 hypothetical protein AOBTE_LOCUS25195 [Acanthoscelides obtectus]
MSSRRRSRSRSRDKKIPSKLRMDTKPPQPRITDPSLPAGRRREIDNVMKKARAQKSPTSGAFWDKKLLEVEAKDPNRWRHSGYKSLYMDGSRSPSPGSRSRSRSRTRSPLPPRRSPPLVRRSPRSPPYRARSPRSPPPSRSSRGRRSSSARRPPSPLPPHHRPPSPRSPRRSPSNSSISSCSDESCSVCSPKHHRGVRSRSRSFSPPHVPVKGRLGRPPSPPPKRVGRPMTPPTMPRPKILPASDRPTDPRRQPPPPRPRGAGGEVIDVRGVRPSKLPPPTASSGTKKKPSTAAGEKQKPMLLKRIKKERTGPKRPGSPESSGSEDSAASSPSPPPACIVATTSMPLSERFSKIAQWSADRERRGDIENMRITKTGGSMKVMMGEEYLYGSPTRSMSPIPSGHFPDKLLTAAQSRTASWEDVRVRYQYYKELGYLRDLTLDDYIKWEEWWYKYQDWLANERHYEHWLSTHGGSSGGGRRRRRKPASQRLN